MGQHWYTPEGQPMHWVEGANGQTRDTNLRDARKLNLLPSVTGIMSVIAKPGLEEWKQTQILLAALTTPRPEGITDDEFIKLIKQSAKQQAEDAANRGNEIHDCLEWLFKGKISLPDGERPMRAKLDILDIATAVKDAVIDYCQTDNFTPEKIVVGNGYAGKTDLSNDDFVLDYKSKDITDKQWDAYEAGKNPYIAYPDQCQQLAAYDKALDPYDCITGRRLVNVFIDRQIPGRIIFHEWTQQETQTAWKVFQNALEIWQLTKKYVPEQ